MTDEKLLSLKGPKRSRASIKDEALSLRLRVKTGKLSEEMLRLAAHCGYEAAQRAFWFWRLRYWHDRQWIQALPSWGEQVTAIAAIACAVEALRCFESAANFDRRPRVALKSAIDWLHCPCDFHAHAAIEAVEVSSPDEMALFLFPSYVRAASSAIATAARSPSPHKRGTFLRQVIDLVKEALRRQHCAEETPSVDPVFVKHIERKYSDLKPGVAEVLAKEAEIWSLVLKPRICHFLIRYALFGWRDFDEMLSLTSDRGLT